MLPKGKTCGKGTVNHWSVVYRWLLGAATEGFALPDMGQCFTVCLCKRPTKCLATVLIPGSHKIRIFRDTAGSGRRTHMPRHSPLLYTSAESFCKHLFSPPEGFLSDLWGSEAKWPQEWTSADDQREQGGSALASWPIPCRDWPVSGSMAQDPLVRLTVLPMVAVSCRIWAYLAAFLPSN